jgi:Na+/H+ antiporter NhaD/arsenite permease-like protein
VTSPLVPATLFVLAIALQALLPRLRLLVVLLGAALAGAWAVGTKTATTGALFAALPWDVFVILVSLGAISEIFARSRLFDRLAVGVTRLGASDPRRVGPFFAVVMFVISGLVNNLTAVLLVMPVLLVLLRLSGTTRRHLRWTLGPFIVACNLGGASTPVGDFPAILLLGAGAMSFFDYLRLALPAATCGLVLFLAAALVAGRGSGGGREGPGGEGQSEIDRRLTASVVEALYRRVRLDTRLLVPAASSLALMLAGWLILPRFGVTPDLVAWGGAVLAGTFAVLLVRRGSGRLLREVVVKALDAESTLFLFALFFMVGVVRQTGLFQELAGVLLGLPLSPSGRLVVFLVASGLTTGLFSAGPSMAALLEVARELATALPPHAVYVGLAMSVCAGSSFFLTAATSGPLAQSLVARARLRGPGGEALHFGFVDFLPVGVLAFVVILAVAVATSLVLARP